MRPIDVGGGFVRVLADGEKRELGGKLAVGQWHPCVTGPATREETPGTTSNGTPASGQLFRFLAAAPEEIRVAAQEPHHGLARARLGDEQLVQLFCRAGRPGSAVAIANEFSRPRRQPQDFGIDQRVADHDLGARQQLRPAQREQPGVARPRANQVNHAFWLHRPILYSGKPARRNRTAAGFTNRRLDYHKPYEAPAGLVMLLLRKQRVGRSLPPIQTVFIILLENCDWSGFKGSADAPYSTTPCCRWLHSAGSIIPRRAIIRVNRLPLARGGNQLWHNGRQRPGGKPPEYDAPPGDAAAKRWYLLEDVSGGHQRRIRPAHLDERLCAQAQPFVFFDESPARTRPTGPMVAHIRPFNELAADLANNTVARYNFITPDLCHAGHDSCPPLNNPVRQVDTWLTNQVPAILNSAAYQNGGALFITWDEGTNDGDGPIGMIVLSPLARGGGYFNDIRYTHSSTLRTVQEIFGVTPLLGDAANAVDLSDLFGASSSAVS